MREPLLAEMDRAGCVRCHAREIGSDWVNLQQPEWSRILRAPMNAGGLGLGWCREAKARPPAYPLITQAHQPPDVFTPHRARPAPAGAPAVASFAGPQDAGYRAMLDVITRTRDLALKSPRVDMPGAAIIPGRCRELPPLSPPETARTDAGHPQ